MATLRFLLKRFVAQRLLGLAVVVTLAFSVGVLVAGPIYADAAREAILSSRARRRRTHRAERAVPGLRGRRFDWDAADEVITDRVESLPLLDGSSGRAWAPSVSARRRARPCRSSRAKTRGAPRDPRRATGRGRDRAPRRRWRGSSASARGDRLAVDRSHRRTDGALGGRDVRQPRSETTPSGSARRARSRPRTRPSRSRRW